MAKKIPLDPLKFTVARKWAEEVADKKCAAMEGRGDSDSGISCYGAGVIDGYMQAIADLRMHGYLESEHKEILP